MIILQLWNFTCCFFSFFLNIRTIYQLIYQKLFYSKPLFYSKTSFLFYAKSRFFMSLYYSSLRVLRAFKFFFYFFILFKFTIWTTILIIKKITKKIYLLTYSHSENKCPVENFHVWDH